MKKETYYIVFDGTTHTVVEKSELREYLDVEDLTEVDIVKEPISEDWIEFSDQEKAIDNAQELDQWV